MRVKAVLFIGIAIVFSVCLVPSYSGDVDGVYAYPVPFKADISDNISFVNLPEEGKIDIYTISGEKVREIEIGEDDMGILNWDVRSDDGQDLASGVYIYLVESEEESKAEKLIIIR